MASDEPPIALDDSQKEIIGALQQSDEALCCIRARSGATQGTLFQLEFLSKGAANVVFRCRPSPSSPSIRSPLLEIVRVNGESNAVRPVSNDLVHQMVLRIPRGMPKCLTGEQIMDGFLHHIVPLFTTSAYRTPNRHATEVPRSGVQRRCSAREDLSKHLMEHQLVALFPEVVEPLLEDEEHGLVCNSSHLPHEARLAILLPDLSSCPGSSLTLEIKPKWLAQSPDAPGNAVRCRTCAMQIVNPKNRDTYICPLRLLEDDYDDLYGWVHGAVATLCQDPTNGFSAPVGNDGIVRLARATTTYLTNGDGRTLLQHLKQLQCRLDPGGVLQQPPTDSVQSFSHDLRLAMTLRDCSLFINISYNESWEPGVIISKLADLDFKSAEKIPDWAEKEARLADEGAYTSKVEDHVDCWLMRQK
ncbi:Inositol-pentakisphosphate 2-kinase [Coniothyrium glycines]